MDALPRPPHVSRAPPLGRSPFPIEVVPLSQSAGVDSPTKVDTIVEALPVGNHTCFFGTVGTGARTVGTEGPALYRRAACHLQRLRFRGFGATQAALHKLPVIAGCPDGPRQSHKGPQLFWSHCACPRDR